MDKILIVYGSLNSVPSPEGAAPAKVIMDTVKHLDKEKFQVLSSHNETLDPTTYDATVFHHVKPTLMDKAFLLLLKIRYRYWQKKELFITAQSRQLLYFIAASRYIKNHQYKKVVVHVSPGLVQMVKLFNPNCKVVFYHHGTSLHSKLSESQWIRLLKYTVAIFGVNQAAGDMANAHFNTKLPSKHYFKVANGVEPIYPAIKNPKGKNDTFQILFSGRICKEKGVLALIKAYKILNDKNYDVSLIIAGHVGTKRGLEAGSKYLKTCKEFVDKHELTVNFTGFLPQAELYGWYKKANVLVLPTDPKFSLEGMSLSLLEAMSTGKPLIATNVGGNPEVIEDAYNGFLIYGTDNYAVEIAEKIERLIKNKDLERTMIANGLKKYKKNFTTKIMSENFTVALKQIGYVH